MSAIEIIYGHEDYFDSFYKALGTVAREKIYLEMIEPPSFDAVVTFQKQLIANSEPVFYALDQGKVVGWCDITPHRNPRLQHRGDLGMGLIAEYRGKGLGSQLVEKAISEARKCGLEKIELRVYTENMAAISLYQKFGFSKEGMIERFRKLDTKSYDCLTMAKFL